VRHKPYASFKMQIISDSSFFPRNHLWKEQVREP